MRFSLSRAAAAALIASASLVAGGCAKDLPRSPVAMPLSDLQAIEIAENYLDDRDGGARASVDANDRERHVAYVEPTGEGNLVSFRSSFDADAEPPVASRLVMVKHTGAVRELRFRDDD